MNVVDAVTYLGFRAGLGCFNAFAFFFIEQNDRVCVLSIYTGCQPGNRHGVEKRMKRCQDLGHDIPTDANNSPTTIHCAGNAQVAVPTPHGKALAFEAVQSAGEIRARLTPDASPGKGVDP
ncbi:MAG: hypothetical protein WDM96_00280 [Lacunisphaera sp.]